jgi:hypothetical protein
MKLVMCMKVRDEDDILELNLRYHHVQGVDQFVVTDNGSTDRTPEILGAWSEAGLVHPISEPSADFKEKAHGWVTRMARLAATDLNADWVIHGDADEFWWPAGGDLKDALASIPDRYGAVIAPRPEFVARPDGPEPFFERMRLRESFSRLRPKIAHRAEPDVVLHRGAHGVDTKTEDDEVRRGGRAVLRAVKPERPEEGERLVLAPRFPLRVLHFPVRSFEQYRLRVETILFHGGWDDKANRELREHYEAGRLEELYRQLVFDDMAVDAGLADGSLVRDNGIGDLLARCPDPLEGPGAALPPPAPGPASDAELAEIELDAMRAISRTERGLIRQVDSLRTRLKNRRRKEQKQEQREDDRKVGRLRAGAARVLRRSSGG